MNEKLTGQYDSLYENNSDVFGAGEPLEQVLALPTYLPKGSVLDIGGGEGRNALYLAKQGFDVTVKDLSRVGLEKLQTKAKQEGLQVQTELSDVIVDGITEMYSSILITFVLHHLEVSNAESLLKTVQDRTVPGGVNIIVTFSNAGHLYERNQKRNKKSFYPSREELLSLYSDWEMLEIKSKQAEILEKNKDGSHKVNLTVYLTAKKPEPFNEPTPNK